MRMIGQISDLGLATFCNAEDHGVFVYLIYRVNIQQFIVSNVSRNTVEALQTVDNHPSTFARIKHRSCHDTLASHFLQAEDGIRDHCVTGVQTCALPISSA